jgi:hypothetical protein
MLQVLQDPIHSKCFLAMQQDKRQVHFCMAMQKVVFPYPSFPR